MEVASILKKLLPSPMGECVIGVNEIAGIANLAEGQRYGFTHFHQYITDPQPDWITSLRASERSRKWYIRLADGIFTNAQGARRAVQYHLDRITEIESAVHEYLSHHDLSNIPPGTTQAIGNTQKLDVEYHAFVFAYRRTLEYFAAGISACFKSDCNSFKDLPNILRRPKSPEAIATPILALVAEHKHRFSFVLSDGDAHRSVRDRISHYEFFSAGTFNITCHGFRLVGGGEELEITGHPLCLGDVLSEKVAFLDVFLNETLLAFTDALRAYHKS